MLTGHRNATASLACAVGPLVAALSLACGHGTSSSAEGANACGRSCLGGSCVDGECTPVTLASGVAVAARLTAPGGYVAWTDLEGDLVALSLDGGSPVTIASPDASVEGSSVANFQGLVGVGATFLWTSYYGGWLGEVTLPGTTAQLLVAPGGPFDPCANDLSVPCGQIAAVASDGTSVYYTANDGPYLVLWKKPLAGGAPTKLYVGGEASASLITIGALALGAANAYVIDATSGSVDAVPLDGGAATVLVSGEDVGEQGQAYPSALAADAEYVYWTAALPGQAPTPPADGGECCPSTSVVRRAPVGGGTAESFVVGTDPDAPVEMATDGTSLYFSTSGHGVKRLAVGAVAGATPETMVASGALAIPAPLAIDTKSVYFERASGDGETATILRVAK